VLRAFSQFFLSILIINKYCPVFSLAAFINALNASSESEYVLESYILNKSSFSRSILLVRL